MQYKQITVIVTDQGNQISDAKAQVLGRIMSALQVAVDDDGKISVSPNSKEALDIASTMSYFFASKSFLEMVEEIENYPVIDEMDAAHSKKEDDYADESSR